MSEERGVRSRKWYETIEQAEMQARARLSDERFAEWQNLRAWQQEQQAQPMSDSHRAWQQQLQQAEMQAQAAAEAPSGWPIELRRPTLEMMDKLEAEAQRADEPAQQYNGRCITCGRITDVVYAGQCCVCDVRSAMSDPPQSEQPATDTSAGAVQQRINDVCQDLVAGRTTPAQQRGLGGAVERAGRIPTGSDAAVGRIARLPR